MYKNEIKLLLSFTAFDNCLCSIFQSDYDEFRRRINHVEDQSAIKERIRKKKQKY